MIIDRSFLMQEIAQEFEIHAVCGLLGARQCGKTTLSLMYAEQQKMPIHIFDCEDPVHLASLDNPLMVFEGLDGLIVIDEIQRRPDLFPVLRVLVDRYPSKRFLITGSASRDLISQSSETLAGRIGYIQVPPFSINEVSTEDWKKLWYRGGFPKSYLATSNNLSMRWRDAYIRTFLERDIAQLGFNIVPHQMGKLWRMLAQMHGQTLNVHMLAEAIDMDQRTIKRYLGILEGAFMITLLRPWSASLNKREVKAPKVYIRDSGLLFRLLSLNEEQIPFYPNLGATFEGFAIEMLQRHFQLYENLFFWGIHNSAELDVLTVHGQKKIGFEIKMTDHPKISQSMHTALELLNLDHLYLIIPMATRTFPMDKKVSCVSITALESIVFDGN
ncbi:MAG: ATP-binding protein [Pseudomonadota bacterium]